jgi:hypothetical protein
MTDDGLAFFATVIATDGTTLHRETDNRGDLLDWLAQHAAPGRGTIASVSMTASGPAIPPMLVAIEFGRAQLAARRPSDRFPRSMIALAEARALHRGGATHDCGEWRTGAGVCAVCDQAVRP